MKRNNMRALLSLALALLLMLSLLPAAFAEGETPAPAGETAPPAESAPVAPSPTPTTVPEAAPAVSPAAEPAPELSPAPEKTYVAKIVREGADVNFETIDAAIADAADGETIILLADCETEGINLDKNLSIEGGYTLTFTKYGIANWGKSLSFTDCRLVMNGIGSTPYTGEWNWMSICGSGAASFTFNNASLSMDGSGLAGKTHAIYLSGSQTLNLNGSSLRISNYPQDAIEWDGGSGGYNLNIIGSSYVSDHNRSGITGTFVCTISGSTVSVINSTGNGSNGSHFNIDGNSSVDFSNNGAHGLSGGKVSIDSSTVTANSNGANGLHVADSLNISGSTVTIDGNGCTVSSKWTIPGALYLGGDASITGSVLTITNNLGSGIYQKAGALTVDPSASVTVTNNTAVKLGLGGGLNAHGASVNLPANFVMYNNHAATAGDDVYTAEGTALTLGKAPAGNLDGTEGTNDCLKPIDAWYEDGEGARWNAHSLEGLHVEAVPAGAFSAPVALKAAHGIPALDELVPADAELFKLDSVTGKPVPGAKFTLYADQGCTQVIGNYISDETGLVTLPDLLLDRSYYMKETKSAEGYRPLSAIFTIKLLENPEKTTENVLEDGEVVSKTYRTALDFEISSEVPCLAETDSGKVAVLNEAFVSANISKVWVDNGETKGRTESVEISLRANGKEIEKITLSGANGWAVTRELPRYDDKGNEIKYSLVELTKVDGYVTGYSTEGFTVYNTLASLAPKTGDDANIWLWVSLMSFCAVAAAGAVIYIKKRGKKEP